MKNILFIAPLAAGKGTQSELLVENFGYIHISTGDLLRGIEPGELKDRIESIIMSGALVPDDIVIELLKRKLLTLKPDDAFILDGFPRSIEQAIKLESLLSEIDKTLDVVILLDVPYEVSLKRTLGRETCPKCRATYNKFSMPSKVEGICDKCSSKLVHRPEDNEETFKLRYKTYLETTTPLIEYYENKGKLVKVDGINNPFETIVSVIKK